MARRSILVARKGQLAARMRDREPQLGVSLRSDVSLLTLYIYNLATKTFRIAIDVSKISKPQSSFV
jgi:hypothetical protein